MSPMRGADRGRCPGSNSLRVGLVPVFALARVPRRGGRMGGRHPGPPLARQPGSGPGAGSEEPSAPPARRGGEALAPARRPPEVRSPAEVDRESPRTASKSPDRGSTARRDRLPDRPGSGVVPPRVDAGRLQEPRRRRARPRLQRLVLRRLPQPGRRRRRRSQRQERRHPLDLDRSDDAPPSPRAAGGRAGGAGDDPSAKIHPGFRTATSVVLHRFGNSPEYDAWRLDRLGLSGGGRRRRGRGQAISRTVPPRSWRSWTSSGRGCRRDRRPSEVIADGIGS